jgi:hypothetical protein
MTGLHNKNLVELNRALDDIQCEIARLESGVAYKTLLPFFEREQSLIAAIREESLANSRALAYEAEEARLLGIRVHG